MMTLRIKTTHVNEWSEKHQRAMPKSWECSHSPVPLGHTWDMGTVSYPESGYESVRAMRRELRRRFPNEKKEDIPNGLRQFGNCQYGIRIIQDVTLEGTL